MFHVVKRLFQKQAGWIAPDNDRDAGQEEEEEDGGEGDFDDNDDEVEREEGDQPGVGLTPKVVARLYLFDDQSHIDRLCVVKGWGGETMCF